MGETKNELGLIFKKQGEIMHDLRTCVARMLMSEGGADMLKYKIDDNRGSEMATVPFS